jgi:phosphate:Na+ symporter
MKIWVSRVFMVLLLLILAGVFYFFPLSRQIISGVAILLFGMYLLENGFSAFAKGPLERALKRLTKYELGSLSLGAISTAILQSSSLISIITISFLSAGLISLSAGMLIVFGANLGTTATSWLVAMVGLKLDIAALALPFIAFGIILNFQKTLPVKGLGNILNGLGFFFLGIEFMKQGFEGLSGLIDLTAYSVVGVQGLLLYTGLGVLMTVIMQSSSAAMTMILASLYVGQISFDNALALAIGTNVGTTVTALLGSIGSGANGKKLAIIHFFFNVITALLALLFFSPFKLLLNYVSQAAEIGANNHTMLLAVFHTLFNMAGIVVIFPWRHFLLKQVNRLYSSEETDSEIKPAALIFSQAGLHILSFQIRDFYYKLLLPELLKSVGLKAEDVLARQKAKQLLLNRTKYQFIDMERVYLEKIKEKYGTLLMHLATIETAELSRKESAQVFRLKVVLRNIVMAYKLASGLQKNLHAAYQHPNREFEGMYFEMSRIMVKTIRYMGQINPRQEGIDKGQISNFLKRTDKFISVIHKQLEELIRKGALDTNQIGSIMNDLQAVAQICRYITDAGIMLQETDFAPHLQTTDAWLAP